jgi:hypothetical protein
MEVGSIVLVGENMGLIFGGGQAIMRNERGYIAGSDSRRDGLAAASADGLRRAMGAGDRTREADFSWKHL